MSRSYELVCPDCGRVSRLSLKDKDENLSEGEEPDRIVRCPACGKYYSRLKLAMLYPWATGLKRSADSQWLTRVED